MKDEVKVFDALKAREVLERVNKFLGVLIRENLVKDAPFLKEGELENESDLADDVWEVLQGVPRNCDIGTPEEQQDRFREFCRRHFDARECGLGRSVAKCPAYQGGKNPDCSLWWAQMQYEEGGAK